MNGKFLRIISCTLAAGALALAPQRLRADSYVQANLVSDIPGMAANTDPNLKNPWGISFGPTSPFWISNQASSTSTLYTGSGSVVPLVVSVPNPTGTVFTAGSGFNEPLGGGSALFAFDTLGGSLYAWNQANGTAAQLAVTTPGAVYVGLALGSVGTTNYLYAANIAGGSIDVYNSSFSKTTLAGSFKDPGLPQGLTPYNVQTINGKIYVTYFNPQQSGSGNGVVSVFNTDGTFVKEIAAGGRLNVPWGMVIAPSGFGKFANDLLVGNFGDGEINAYDPNSGTWLGTLEDSKGNPIVNSGLWALETRTGAGYNVNGVYFDAGINGQKDGLLGVISPSPEPLSAALAGIGLAGLGIVALRRRKAAKDLVSR